MIMVSRAPPERWERALWYAFLLAWMQGMALLNVAWGLLLPVLLRRLPEAWRQLRPRRMVVAVVGAYLGWRILTTLWADAPRQAMVGLFDDARALTIGLVALVMLEHRRERVRAAWLSFAGVALLSWWSLACQLTDAGLRTTGHTIYGTFAHLNYSATYSMIAMLIMLHQLTRMAWRQGRWMIAGIVPIAAMQIPLGSRTVLLAALIGCLLFALWRRQRRVVLALAGAGLLMGGLAWSVPHWTGQFSSLSAIEGQLQGRRTMPSLQIRLEIWGLLVQITRDHPWGLGPRNHGYIDLRPYRGWIEQHMPTALSATFGADAEVTEERLHLLLYDPHSQYMEALVDGGIVGLLSLLAMLALPVVLARGSDMPDELFVAALIVCWMYAWSGLTVTIFHQAGLIIYFLLLALLLRERKECPQGERP
ncbi:MAG: O-antigen ligase domain-containing protein [Zetaproteobacteria bacterium]|nr:MAG: O-antigen ligase domain-containing protein [Zetaproteobacteria bacterium]